ncbi:ACSL4 [Cordylochernes scorpioides]|uniref:long-chain-fatty-acid--CoA ligase n=1 Tax=Cordylochernes scorpioides TaxID=51811 RepID=A0ABY6KWR1_9ARAC|nr:ACSL4 [Cordylochernes scorpioides]
MYTSGSTGIPKDSWRALNAEWCRRDEMYIGYLPLAHIFELSAECISSLNGIPIGYSSPLTLTDNSTAIPSGGKGDATLLKPTFMVAVPLVLDRIRKGIVEKVESRGKFAKSFFNFAVKYKIRWYRRGFCTPLLDRLVFKKVREVVGGRLRFMASGGAPLSADTHDFIRASLGVMLQQGYGLTETGSCATVMLPEDRYSGRVGAPLSVCRIRLEDWSEGGYSALDHPNPRGEIIIGGPCVSAGYYKNEEATREAYSTDEEGISWFATGDIGELFPDGSVKIIDRKKDLVKLQYGEYVSLGKVEAELKSCPMVDNLCVYGSSFHAYIVALVSPSRNYLRNLAKELGKSSLSFEQMCDDKVITTTATKILIDYAKKCGLQKTEIPTKIKLCHEEWVPDSGLVTAALKIRRKPIEKFYEKAIQALYAENS